MQKLITIGLCLGTLMIATVTTASATENPSAGQSGAPANTCGPDNPVIPGGAGAAPGSPFNPSGQAGVVYAGNPDTASLSHSNSTATVSQYDTACVRLSNPPR